MRRDLVSNTFDLSPWSGLKNDLWDIFDRFSNDMEPSMNNWSFTPKLEVKDLGKTYQVSLEVPGMDEKDINLTVRDNILTVEGEKKREEKKEDKDKGLYQSEFSYGRFYRTVPLPESVNTENVNAFCKNGVLEIQFEKQENPSKAKKIQIGSGNQEKH